jgi:thiol:disulfide interchange protein
MNSASLAPGRNAPPSGDAGASSVGPDNSLSGSRSDSGATGSGASADNGSLPVRLPSQTNPDNKLSGPTENAQPLLIAVLGAAFIGGLILNLMPCVLPVLSLKVFALIKHAGEHPEKAWKQGVAFAVGVVVSFWVLAGLLLALRAAGNQLGWGFQMQSPGFVAALIVLFFVIGLNLFGVFEIGGSLVGVDAKAASHAGGSVSSFLNGALATVAATPCTAPFMGSALGFAAQQPAFVSMLIFTFLALGMAAPYLLLTIFPQSLRFVPKPGAWMESLKQFMGFLLMGTVIFLVYVLDALLGTNLIPFILGDLLLIAIAAWIYGKWSGPTHSGQARAIAITLSAALFLFAVVLPILGYTPMDYAARSNVRTTEDGYQDWSPEAVQAALAKGQPVFVDFTAAWCLSCKVNERVALGTDGVKKAFADKNVALFRADWTHADPVISQTLQKFNRDGVPLYLLYSPKSPDAPQVLPEVLTPGIVLEALGKI